MLSSEPFKKRRWLPCAIGPHGTLDSGARALVVAGLAGVSFFAMAMLAWPFSVDDAFIALRYATRLAGGNGYTFSDGPPTDGVTGPLWLLPLWVCARAGLTGLAPAKLLGALAMALSVARVVGRVRMQVFGKWAAALTLAMCATSIPLAIWAVAGLETGLATLCATELGLAVTRRTQRAGWGRALHVGLLAGLCGFLRPELSFWVLVWLACFSRAEPRRVAWVAWMTAGVLTLGLVGFRLAMFGHVLPMTAAAKPADVMHGLRYVGGALLRPDVSLVLVLCSLGCLKRKRRAARLAYTQRKLGTVEVTLLASAAHVLAVVLAGGDWMPGLRLFAPMLPLFFGAYARCTFELFCARRRLATLALCALLSLRLFGFVPELLRAREMGPLQARAREFYAAALRDVHGPVVALDIGLLGDVYAGPIVDLGGLTEPHMAYARGAHLDKHVESTWLEAQRPELIVLHSSAPPRVDSSGYIRWFQGYPVERRVLAMPWILQGYAVFRVERFSENYYYVMLTRRP